MIYISCCMHTYQGRHICTIHRLKPPAIVTVYFTTSIYTDSRLPGSNMPVAATCIGIYIVDVEKPLDCKMYLKVFGCAE